VKAQGLKVGTVLSPLADVVAIHRFANLFCTGRLNHPGFPAFLLNSTGFVSENIYHTGPGKGPVRSGGLTSAYQINVEAIA
jgi:hypothetical protein